MLRRFGYRGSPTHLDPTRRVGQRTIFRSVGCEFVKDERQVDSNIPIDHYVRSFKHNPAIVALIWSKLGIDQFAKTRFAP